MSNISHIASFFPTFTVKCTTCGVNLEGKWSRAETDSNGKITYHCKRHSIFLEDLKTRNDDVAPRYGTDVTGYGMKVPTRRWVHVNNRWRRVYCTIYGNSGTCWFVLAGKSVTVH